MNSEENDYVLRFSVTGNCNLNCFYCKKNSLASQDNLDKEETIEIVKSAVVAGIRQISWTGGEPTTAPWLSDVIAKAKKMGIKNQTMTTNGVTLHKKLAEFKKAGINRFNISLDCLDRKKYFEITGKDNFNDVLKSIDLCAKEYDNTKINCVIVKNNFSEIPNFVKFCEKYAGRICVRFLELVPCGEAFGYDPTLFAREFVPVKAILKELGSFGELLRIDKKGFVPKSIYFKIKGMNGIYGVNPNKSAGYACDKQECKKIRVSPNGYVSNCTINLCFAQKLKGKTFKEKVRIMKEIVAEKQNRTYKGFKHKQKYYSFWRFGLISDEAASQLKS